MNLRTYRCQTNTNVFLLERRVQEVPPDSVTPRTEVVNGFMNSNYALINIFYFRGERQYPVSTYNRAPQTLSKLK